MAGAKTLITASATIWPYSYLAEQTPPTMKAVILAGGLGTRLAEETVPRPKPMVEIRGKPILWHIMKGYAHFGIDDFVICLGYKGYMMKEYFANLALHNSDVTINLAQNRVELHQNSSEPWNITLADTGEQTQTGGRLDLQGPRASGFQEKPRGDATHARKELGWRPRWGADEALRRTLEWYRAWNANPSDSDHIRALTLAQIDDYTAMR